MIIGNPIMAGASGPSASIFVTGLSETDTVTAVHKKTVQVPNPNYIGLPDGYTQLEYIESTGTQYIDTGVIPNTNSGYEFDVTINSPFTSSDSISTGSIIGCYNALDEAFTVSVYTARFETGDVAFGSGRYAAHLVIGSRMQISLRNHIYTTSTGGTETISDSLSATISAYLFASHDTSVSGNVWGMAKAIMYSAKMYDGGTIIRNYIPAKRISDSAIGLYDLVNNVFYTNAGTGTFTAGSVIPAYIEMTVDDKTLTGKWTQKPNPAAHGLPDGYTELEYIESTGTQYIETNVALSSTVECWLDFQLTSTNSPQVLCGADQSGSTTIQYQVVCDGPSNGLRLTISGVEARPTSNADLNRHSLGLNWDGRYSYDGSDLGEAGVYSGLTDITVALCRSNYRGGLYASMKIFASKIKKDSSLVRDFIPCKRTSDNAIGLYDLVSNSFFENAGTGTFTAGSEIPQTVDGFLIKPIRDFGTWTVTATDGTYTYTQDVLVDVITEYEIEITKKLYLYRDGDECEEVTGGWSQNTNWIHGSYTFSGSKTLIKNNDNLYLPSVSADASNATATNKIDFSNYNTLYIELENVGNGSDSSPYVLIADSVGQVNQFADMVTSTRNVYTVDVTSISGMKVLAFECISGRSVKIYKVWLE